jgi:hypothetical protein
MPHRVTHSGLFPILQRSNSPRNLGFEGEEKHSGKRSVRLTFDGNADLDFRDVCKSVAVRGATLYKLSGSTPTRALTTDQGVLFELRSGTPGAPPLTTIEAHGTPPWARRETTRASEKDSHEGETCLRRPSDQENDKIQGAAWMDDAAQTTRAKSSVKP